MDQPSLKRIALILQYLGTHFHGWQRQPGQRTVQSELEGALSQIEQRDIVVHAAGRTDTGVHAAAQVVHFDSKSPIPPHRWQSVLNSRLPNDLLVRASSLVPEDWHACFSAQWRRYRYTLYTDSHPNLFVRQFTWHYYRAPLDESLINSALQSLLGHHDLAAFRRAGSSRPHSWVDIQSVECYRDGAFLSIEVQASGFLYGMMRLLVGLLVHVGQGSQTPQDFMELWQNREREKVKYAAPACGLCLLRVGYANFPFATSVWYDTQPQFHLPL